MGHIACNRTSSSVRITSGPNDPQSNSDTAHNLVGEKIQLPTVNSICMQVNIDLHRMKVLGNHIVGVTIVPHEAKIDCSP